MSQTVIVCQECGNEIVVQRPGQRVAAAYVTIGVSNSTTFEKLAIARRLVSEAAGELPFRDDLGRAAKLLHEIEIELNLETE